MKINRKQITNILDVIEEIKTKKFNINTQYKMLLIKKYIKEDLEVIEEQYQLLIEQYGEKDKNGLLIRTENGGIKIKQEYIEDCQQKIQDFNNLDITIPDITFSIDELEELNLSFEKLEYFMPFIK